MIPLLLTISAVAVPLAICLMMRSTKEMPKNFAQLKSELIYQYLGVLGVIDDVMSRKRNRIGESRDQLPFKTRRQVKCRRNFDFRDFV